MKNNSDAYKWKCTVVAGGLRVEQTEMQKKKRRANYDVR